MAEKSTLESDVSPNSKAQPIMSLVISNVGGPSDGRGTSDRRKKAIAGMLQKIQPNIVLFQEFPWSGIRRKSTWKDIAIPEKYEYVGSNGASILYDKNELNVNILKDTRKVLEEMIRKGKLHMGFTPLPNMCIVEVKTKGVPLAHFLCISWHGSHNSKKETDLLKELEKLFVFIAEISKKMELPYILAGDFNLRYEKVYEKFKDPKGNVYLYLYTPLKRREGKLIDYFISSNTLPLADIAAVDWETVDNGKDATKIFDHDPVVATLMTHVSKPSASEQHQFTATKKETRSEEESRK